MKHELDPQKSSAVYVELSWKNLLAPVFVLMLRLETFTLKLDLLN